MLRKANLTLAARTADVEVAHRAFLVPPHKKRGKGGRQPASDPRLDPNIDERKAKRILANRLSAARSKMKQKNQMDVSMACTSSHGLYKDAECNEIIAHRNFAQCSTAGGTCFNFLS